MLSVAVELQRNPHLTFYVINLSLNEPHSLQVEETPVLYLYKPQSSRPIKFRGPMKSRLILAFLAKYMGRLLNEVMLDGSEIVESLENDKPNGETSGIARTNIVTQVSDADL